MHEPGDNEFVITRIQAEVCDAAFFQSLLCAFLYVMFSYVFPELFRDEIQVFAAGGAFTLALGAVLALMVLIPLTPLATWVFLAIAWRVSQGGPGFWLLAVERLSRSGLVGSIRMGLYWSFLTLLPWVSAFLIAIRVPEAADAMVRAGLLPVIVMSQICILTLNFAFLLINTNRQFFFEWLLRMHARRHVPHRAEQVAV